ncbi:peptide deformylase [Amycolatopsis sp. NPDC004368]
MLADQVDELLSLPLPWPIVQAGHPVLRTPAAPYDGSLGEAALAALIEGMKETMHAAPGVGLAAPQIGLPVQIAVLEDYERPNTPPEVKEARGFAPLPFRVLVNPRYTALGAERVAFFEGCLSVSGWQAVVARPLRVRLQAQDETGAAVDEEIAGWPARIVQHETDHLGGMLYLDRAELRSLSTHEAVAQRWAQATAAEAAKDLGFDLP